MDGAKRVMSKRERQRWRREVQREIRGASEWWYVGKNVQGTHRARGNLENSNQKPD